MSRRVVAVVQARMGSTRLPGKVLELVGERPLVDHVLVRTQAIDGVDEVVLATTSHPRDDALVDHASTLGGVEIVRGSEENVLSRFVKAARRFEADVIVRITSDCPLLSPRVSSRVLADFLQDPTCDYCSNTLDRTFPRGLDTEVISRGALETADEAQTRPADREHVTPFIWRQPMRFRLRNVRDEVDHSDLRWTVDVPEDLELVRRIYGTLYRPGGVFEYEDVLTLLDAHPDWSDLNRGVRQKDIPS